MLSIPVTYCPVCQNPVVETRVVWSADLKRPDPEWWGKRKEWRAVCEAGQWLHFTDGKADKLAIMTHKTRKKNIRRHR